MAKDVNSRVTAKLNIIFTLLHSRVLNHIIYSQYTELSVTSEHRPKKKYQKTKQKCFHIIILQIDDKNMKLKTSLTGVQESPDIDARYPWRCVTVVAWQRILKGFSLSVPVGQEPVNLNI